MWKHIKTFALEAVKDMKLGKMKFSRSFCCVFFLPLQKMSCIIKLRLKFPQQSIFDSNFAYFKFALQILKYD